MPIKCVPIPEAEKLKKGLANGDIDIAKFYDMTSAERKAKLQKYVGKDLASFINKEFERAMLSSRKDALKNWVEKTFTNKEKKRELFKEIDEINQLLDSGQQLNMIEDFVADKIGIAVTAKELKEITYYTEQMKKVYEETDGMNTDIVDNYGKVEEYWKLESDLKKYIVSVEPTNVWNIYTNLTGKMVMLFSLKSPALNISSNFLMKGTGSIVNRIESAVAGKPILSGLNGEYARKYVIANAKLFYNTGYDTSRMDDISDSKRILGEKYVSAEGKGIARAIARPINWIVGDIGLGTPDAFFASWSFANKADFESSVQAFKEGYTGKQAQKRALEIFKDSTKINPETEIGKKIREIAKEDARYYTFTNKSWAQHIGKSSRDYIDKISDQLN